MYRLYYLLIGFGIGYVGGWAYGALGPGPVPGPRGAGDDD